MCQRSTNQLVTTESDGWIFVLRDNAIFANAKKTDTPPRSVSVRTPTLGHPPPLTQPHPAAACSHRFHHSSFFAGECIQAAGLFIAVDGVLTRLYPHSGERARRTMSCMPARLSLTEQTWSSPGLHVAVVCHVGMQGTTVRRTATC